MLATTNTPMDRVVRNKLEAETYGLILSLDNGTSKAAILANKLMAEDWQIVVADQRCGYCHYQSKTIVLPKWLFSKSAAYYNYYLSHELAHAVVGSSVQPHGLEFMTKFKEICDPDNWRYELSYKPRAAKAMGIIQIADDF